GFRVLCRGATVFPEDNEHHRCAEVLRRHRTGYVALRRTGANPMTGTELLKQQFNGHVAFRERRPGVIQVLAPLFHEDGDMVDIFIDEPRNGSNRVRISDHGMTLMRLTYNYDLDTENKLRIFNRIL